MCLMLESCWFSYNKIEVVRYNNFTNQVRSHVFSVDINGALKNVYICLHQHKYSKYNKECYLNEIWIAPQTKLIPFKLQCHHSKSSTVPQFRVTAQTSQAGTILNYQNRKSLPLWALWIRIWWEAIYKRAQFSASSMRMETMLSTEPINLTSQESSFETSNSRLNFCLFFIQEETTSHFRWNSNL